MFYCITHLPHLDHYICKAHILQTKIPGSHIFDQVCTEPGGNTASMVHAWSFLEPAHSVSFYLLEDHSAGIMLPIKTNSLHCLVQNNWWTSKGKIALWIYVPYCFAGRGECVNNPSKWRAVWALSSLTQSVDASELSPCLLHDLLPLSLFFSLPPSLHPCSMVISTMVWLTTTQQEKKSSHSVKVTILTV